LPSKRAPIGWVIPSVVINEMFGEEITSGAGGRGWAPAGLITGSEPPTNTAIQRAQSLRKLCLRVSASAAIAA
jgi:hypothetical protein